MKGLLQVNIVRRRFHFAPRSIIHVVMAPAAWITSRTTRASVWWATPGRTVPSTWMTARTIFARYKCRRVMWLSLGVTEFSVCVTSPLSGLLLINYANKTERADRNLTKPIPVPFNVTLTVYRQEFKWAHCCWCRLLSLSVSFEILRVQNIRK